MKTASIFLIWFVWVLLCPTVIYLLASFVSWEWWSFADASGEQRGGFLFGTVVCMGISFWAPLLTKEHFYGYS